MISKKEGEIEKSVFLTFSQNLITFCSEISWLLTTILSLKSSICGDVNVPTLYPSYIKIEEIIFVVVPFPFVPAT